MSVRASGTRLGRLLGGGSKPPGPRPPRGVLQAGRFRRRDGRDALASGGLLPWASGRPAVGGRAPPAPTLQRFPPLPHAAASVAEAALLRLVLSRSCPLDSFGFRLPLPVSKSGYFWKGWRILRTCQAKHFLVRPRRTFPRAVVGRAAGSLLWAARAGRPRKVLSAGVGGAPTRTKVLSPGVGKAAGPPEKLWGQTHSVLCVRRCPPSAAPESHLLIPDSPTAPWSASWNFLAFWFSGLGSLVGFVPPPPPAEHTCEKAYSEVLFFCFRGGVL